MSPETAHFVKAAIERDPLLYRSFGPWWWLIKAWLRKHGMSVGNYSDPLAKSWFGEPEWTLESAFDHHQEAVALGRAYLHQCTSPDGGDDYYLHDPDLEP